MSLLSSQLKKKTIVKVQQLVERRPPLPNRQMTPFDRLRHCYSHVYTHISTSIWAVGASEDSFIYLYSIIYNRPVFLRVSSQYRQRYDTSGNLTAEIDFLFLFTFHPSASYLRIDIIPIGCYSCFFFSISSHHRHYCQCQCQCLTSAQVFSPLPAPEEQAFVVHFTLS